MHDRFLPGIPQVQVEEAYDAAPGNEIASGRFDSPESSASLVANTFGFFLNRPSNLPPLPGCEGTEWPATSVALEKELRFPWKGGRHPWLDTLVVTPSALIGIESKRFEPYRFAQSPGSFSDAFWEREERSWGERMTGYRRVRDQLRNTPDGYSRLDAAQLVKHALALRTRVGTGKQYEQLMPILLYLFVEPDVWPRDGKPVEKEAKALHSQEVNRFAQSVEGDEVKFVAVSYRQLLEAWTRNENQEIREHAIAIASRFSI